MQDLAPWFTETIKLHNASANKIVLNIANLNVILLLETICITLDENSNGSTRSGFALMHNQSYFL